MLNQDIADRYLPFKDELLSVVNEGGDADTNAAIACAILGTKFGFAYIPRYYISNV